MVGIKVENITKKYLKNGELILKNLSFDIEAKDKIGILGPNGAGKTTLISIICGLLNANTGKVEYFNNNNEISYQEFKNLLGYVPQELALYQELSPIQNLNYFGAMYNMPKELIAKESEILLSKLGLLHVKNQKAKTFSGGMKRRLNLAISLLHKPKILFLDEPTVGIDVQSKNAIISLLNELNTNGTTIIYTSHHLNEAEVLCNKVLFLDNGIIIDYNTIENLKFKTKLATLEEIFLFKTGASYRD